MIHSMYIGICQKRHHSISNNCTYLYINYIITGLLDYRCADDRSNIEEDNTRIPGNAAGMVQ